MSILQHNTIHMKTIMLDKTKILDLYLNEKMSIVRVAKELKISKNKVAAVLKETNVTRTISQCRTKYTFDHLFFNTIDTEVKAYYLGLMFADGNVSINRGSPTIRLTSKDKSILEELIKELRGDCKIYREVHKKYNKECFKIRLTSKQMYNDLIALGCIPRKSLVLTFPTILPDSLISHFIRGYFDGDGTVGLYGVNHSMWKRLTSGFCGTQAFLISLVQHLPVTHKIVRRSKNLYLLRFSVQDSINLYWYMYKDATVFLTRKHDIFYDSIKQRGSTTTIDSPPHRWRVKV